MAHELEAVELLVRPGGSREGIASPHGGLPVVRLTAPPAEGRANRALVKLIAKRARVPASRVRIVRGARSRRKVVAVEGLEAARLRELLTPEG